MKLRKVTAIDATKDKALVKDERLREAQEQLSGRTEQENLCTCGHVEALHVKRRGRYECTVCVCNNFD